MEGEGHGDRAKDLLESHDKNKDGVRQPPRSPALRAVLRPRCDRAPPDTNLPPDPKALSVDEIGTHEQDAESLGWEPHPPHILHPDL